MRAVAFGLALSAILISTNSYAREYVLEVSRSFPELPSLNKQVAPELSQEAFHTHWCLQTYEAEVVFEHRISKGQRTLHSSHIERYLHWWVLWSRNPITNEQKRAIREKVEEVYGTGPDKNGYVYRTNHQAAVCSPNYYPISLEEWRLRGSVPGLSQKAYHAHWCYQVNVVLRLMEYLTTGFSSPASDYFIHWEAVSKEYPITPQQEGEVRTHVYEFYNYGPDKVPSFITDVHQHLQCDYKSARGFYGLGVQLFNTAKE